MWIRTLVMAGLLASAAVAKSDGPPPALEPAALGRLAGALEVCMKADPDRAKLYARYRTELVVLGEGTANEIRAPGTDTPAYREAHASVLEAAGKLSTDDLLAQCHEGFADTAAAGN